MLVDTAPSEGADVDEEKEEASFSALRLLYTALSNRAPLADAICSAGSTLIISSLDSLLFGPVSISSAVGGGKLQMKTDQTCLSLVASFISEVGDFDSFSDSYLAIVPFQSESLARHTFYALKILRVAGSQRPSLQPRLVQSIYSLRTTLIHAAASICSAQLADVEVTQSDLIPMDVEVGCKPSRLRGELIRHLFETLADAMESDPSTANVAYLMLGFNLRDIGSSEFSSFSGEWMNFLAACLMLLMSLFLYRWRFFPRLHCAAQRDGDCDDSCHDRPTL